MAAEQKLQGALTHKSDLEEAHSELAKRYRRQHQQAEWKRDVQAAKKAEVRLREHASALSEANPERLSHFAYLEGIGSVSVRTDVEGVEVSLDRYVEHHRRLIPNQPLSWAWLRSSRCSCRWGPIAFVYVKRVVMRCSIRL